MEETVGLKERSYDKALLKEKVEIDGNLTRKMKQWLEMNGTVRIL